MYAFTKPNKIAISVTISTELLERLKKVQIPRSYALSIGGRKLLGDEIVIDQTQSYSELKDKVTRLTERLNNILREKYDLEEKLQEKGLI